MLNLETNEVIPINKKSLEYSEMTPVLKKGAFSLSREDEVLIFSPSISPGISIFISDLDSPSRRCKIHFQILPELRLKPESLMLGWMAIEFLFESEGLRKVHTEVVATEVSEVDFLRKLGFCEEGRLSKHISVNDRFCDVLLMSHFKETWDKKKKNLEDFLFVPGASL